MGSSETQVTLGGRRWQWGCEKSGSREGDTPGNDGTEGCGWHWGRSTDSCVPQPYIEEICQNLRGGIFQKFIER